LFIVSFFFFLFFFSSRRRHTRFSRDWSSDVCSSDLRLEPILQIALRMKKDEFDQAFERYLKDRFKPFRDKERPADYGRDLSPNKEKTPYIEAISIAPSPSGDLIAVTTFNRKDGEIDVILVSSKDGSIVRNLTNGF